MHLKELYDYWQSHTAGDVPPRRQDVDPPIQIPHILPWVFLVDREGREFRLRLVGSEIVARAGKDNTGRKVDATLMDEQSLASWITLLSSAWDAQEPVLYSFDLKALEPPRGLLLPLLDDDGQTKVLLCGLFFQRYRGFIRRDETTGLFEVPIKSLPLEELN